MSYGQGQATYPGPMPSAGAAGSYQRAPQAQQNGQQMPAPNLAQPQQFPQAQGFPGTVPGAWQQQGVSEATPLGVGYSGGPGAGQLQVGPNGQPMVQQGVQPQGYQQPQGYPQAPQQQTPVAQLQPNMILDGPGVPQELRGRSVSQVMDVYGALMQHYARTRTQPPGVGVGGQPGFSAQPGAQPSAAPPASAPAQPGGYRPQNYGVLSGQPQGGQDDDDAIADRVVQKLAPMFQPLMQSNLANGLAAATMQARSMIPDFAELEGDLINVMGQAAPQVAASVDNWIAAADYVRGKRFRSQHQQPQQQNGQQPVGGYQQPQTYQPRQNGGQPQAFVPAYPIAMGAPAAQQPHFFTEGPSAPIQTPNGSISQAERVIMEQFRMTPDQWIAHRDASQRRGY